MVCTGGPGTEVLCTPRDIMRMGYAPDIWEYPKWQL